MCTWFTSRFLAFCAIAIGLGPCTHVLSAQQLADDARRLGEFHLAGMRDARERVRSGVCNVAVRKAGTNRKSTSDGEYFFAFSLNDDCLRFDQRFGSRVTQYARNKRESMLHVAGSRGITKYAPDWKVSIPEAQPFDFRLIGLVSLAEFDYRCSYDDVRRFLEQRAQLSEVVREDATLCRLSWKYDIQSSNLRHTIWIDSSRGFSPVRTEVIATHHPKDGPTITRNQAATKTDWQRVSDVWVPRRWSLSEGDGTLTLEATFDWKSVNEPIAEKLFQVEGLEAPDGTLVVNNRLGTPIVESTIGQTDAREPGFGTLRGWRIWIIGAIVLVAFAVVLVLVLRRRMACA